MTKCRSLAEDVEKVTSLLHCLAGRLARVEGGVVGEESQGKRERLEQQMAEAQGLRRYVEERTQRMVERLETLPGLEGQGERLHLVLEERRGLVVEIKEVEERRRTVREALEQ